MNFKFEPTTLIELYTDILEENTENLKFSLGYVVKVLDNSILFVSISEIGTLDSIQLRNKNYISSIESNTEYTEMFEFYINFSKHNNLFDPFLLEKKLKFDQVITSKKVLESLFNEGNIVSIITTNLDYIIVGRIICLHEKIMTISLSRYQQNSEVSEIKIELDSIICIDLVSVENFIYSKYESYKNQ